MHTKSEAHEPLSLLAQCDGVPPQIIMDGSKEQTLGKFHKKLGEMGCEICQMEPDFCGRMLPKVPSARSTMGPAGNKPRRDPHSSYGTIAWSWRLILD